MAATMQTQSANANSASSVKNPQLKRLVYSKYREMLGSYNDKANAIIETLPAYMVKEDRGFHFDPSIIGQVGEVVMYGAPSAPSSIASGGNIPAQRLPEAPACVQNAMMTKDKKPFTYTPGGIDLSQIKSQRMAKRLARNAQIEGATGAAQQNRPTQSQNNGSPQQLAQAPAMGAAAMGMPFQVFPTGPPAAVQSMKKQQTANGSVPPPPPPPSTLAPPGVNISNGAPGSPNTFRKSPTPQNFEPPPMGFRPEIKIPPNPMAALKKVPPPQEKNNFWMEEYRRENSKSPMVGNDENDYNNATTLSTTQPPELNNNPQQYSNQNLQQQQQQQNAPSSQPSTPRSEFRSVAPPQSPSVSVYTSLDKGPYQQQLGQNSPTPQRAASPFKFAQQQAVPQQTSSPLSLQQSPQYQQQQQQLPQQTASVPWRSQNSSGSSTNQSPQVQESSPQSPNQVKNSFSRSQDNSAQEQSQPLHQYNNVRSREVPSPGMEQQQQSHSPQLQYQQKNSNVGSLYIPPLEPQQQAMKQAPQQQQPRQAPTNRWMTTQPAPKEHAEWARPEETSNVVPSSINRTKSVTSPSQGNGYSANNYNNNNNNNTATSGVSGAFGPSGLRLQIITNPSNQQKERIIPIQMEQSPTPTRNPAQPGFGPQPFYNSNQKQQQQQYSTVPSPPSGPESANAALPCYVVRSPNHFVDQGYNNLSQPSQPDVNRVMSPTVYQQQQQQQQPQQQMQSPRNNQQSGNPGGAVKTRIIPIAIEGQSDNNVRGPISQSPMVIQNDPRSLQHQNSWGANGSSIPNQSKSFRILQKITDTAEGNGCSSTDSQTAGTPSASFEDSEPQLQRPHYSKQMGPPQQMNSPTIEQMRRMQIGQEQQARSQGTPPLMKQPQTPPNRYVQQRSIYEDAPQNYIHPSEQHVPEPKIYTGSAIPSRSFRILQAMTTPENAGPGQSDL